MRVSLLRSFPNHLVRLRMPPKRQSSTTASSKGKQSKDNSNNSNKKPKLSVDRDHQKQASLTSFFASNSPTKSATSNGNGLVKVEDAKVQEQDASRKNKMNDKGKGRAIQDDQAIDVDALSQEDWSIDQEERRQIQKDEDFARSIQQEWNENGHDSSATATTFRSNPTLPSTSSASSSRTQALAPLFSPKVKKEEAIDDDGKLLFQQSTTSTNTSSPIFSSSSTTQSRPQSTQSSPVKSKTTIAFNYAALEESINSIPLSEDIFSFDPTRIDTSSWPRATTTTTSSSNPDSSSSSPPTTPYALLTAAFVLISSTKSRLFITTVLTNLIRTIRVHDRQSLLASVYLVSNHIAPAYDGIELGLGGAITNKVIKEVTGISAQKMKSLWNKTGDPGDVAYEAKKDVKPLVQPPPITVQKLFSTLHSIAKISGTGSGAQKGSLVSKLVVASRGEETRFLVRTLHANLRISAVKTTIATSLARAFTLIEKGAEESKASTTSTSTSLLITPKERKGLLANPTKAKERSDPKRLEAMEKISKAEKMVREVRARHPNFSTIVPALLDHSIDELSKRVPLSIGTPISPMLGSITRSLDAMHTKLGSRAFCSEFKYDGQRCQIHAQWFQDPSDEFRKALASTSRGKWTGPNKDVYVRLFSRHLEDQTSKYPDICDLVPLLLGAETVQDSVKGEERKVKSFIMDAEIVAVGLGGELLPFQTLTNRSRKDVDLGDVKVKVGVFAFDLMYLDGASLLKMSFRRRRQLLYSKFPSLDPTNPLIARFTHVKSLESTDPDEVAAFFELARSSKCEGIMVKSLDHHWETDVKVSKSSSSSSKDKENEDHQYQSEFKLEKLEDVVGEEMQMEEDGVAPAVQEIGIGKGVNGRGKALLSTYEPDKRCESWLKVKKDYVDGIGDSLDLVPIGAWHGMGRKAAWWSPILLAVYDEESGVYQAVCKCISGFTDAEYKSLRFERFVEGSETCYDARSQPCRQSYETGGLLPDVWFEPVECWEVRGADITLSPNYTAAQGLVSAERGLSMRFPRFLKKRDDKGPLDSTTPKQLAKLYMDQNNAGDASTGKKVAAAEGERDEDENEMDEENED